MRCFSHLWILLVLITAGLDASLTARAAALGDEPALKGTYVGIRHGESVPSSERRVCGSLAAGVDPSNGLTAEGRVETRAATLAWIEEQTALIETALREHRLVILSSPFSRTHESADIIAETIEQYFQPSLNTPPGMLKQQIRIEPDLRERDFGRYEGQFDSHLIYRRVWDQDALDPTYSGEGIESALAVQSRLMAIIARLEEESAAGEGWVYLLVSHGDPLKILATGFDQVSASAHQDPEQVPPFRTAEFRVFQWRSAQTAAP
jgi:broad specificity phosphatase PhoE